MAVFKEGYHIVNEIEKSSKQIYPDACDYGAPVTKGDKLWNNVNQLFEWYGEKESKKVIEYSTGTSAEFIAELIFEGDAYKGLVERFKVEYHTIRDHKDMDGFVSVYKL